MKANEVVNGRQSLRSAASALNCTSKTMDAFVHTHCRYLLRQKQHHCYQQCYHHQYYHNERMLQSPAPHEVADENFDSALPLGASIVAHSAKRTAADPSTDFRVLGADSAASCSFARSNFPSTSSDFFCCSLTSSSTT